MLSLMAGMLLLHSFTFGYGSCHKPITPFCCWLAVVGSGGLLPNMQPCISSCCVFGLLHVLAVCYFVVLGYCQSCRDIGIICWFVSLLVCLSFD